jgi:hypothetical protein
MITNNYIVPEKFLLFFDCNSQDDVDYVKRTIERTNTPGDELYDASIDKFRWVMSPGVFAEDMYANGTGVRGVRYGSGESYNDEWMMRCAEYSILVFSNCGDLIIDLAQEIGHSVRIQRDNVKYAKIIADAIKDYRENGRPIDIAIDIEDLCL